ncbi:hypothetical protein AB4Y72_14800 [Arthrobacter sp. YAF34]|uniref:hypothetical protein n=1 Tax=Arthrobacter sp. YAF34 TaxID=3233083 RepID=UPI003F92E3B2
MPNNELQPYEPFTRWVAQYLANSAAVNGRVSGSARTWMRAFGIVAGRVDRYLELGHGGGQTLPSSLVLDIIELVQSPYAQGLSLVDPRRELLGTWRGLARVYGTNASPRERELNRLEMLTHWTKAIVSLPGTGFPGEKLMVIRYRHERQRLDLTQLRGGEHYMRYVGLLVDLLKDYEREIPVMCRPLTARSPRKAAPVASKVSQQVCRAEIPQQGRRPVLPDAGSSTRTSPVPVRAVKKQVAASCENKLELSMDESVFFGNQGDYWRNARS